jgi:hypothetical protein
VIQTNSSPVHVRRKRQNTQFTVALHEIPSINCFLFSKNNLYTNNSDLYVCKGFCSIHDDVSVGDCHFRKTAGPNRHTKTIFLFVTFKILTMLK